MTLWPLGYVTGCEVPEKKNGGSGTPPGKGDWGVDPEPQVPKSTGPMVTKVVPALVPETMAAKNTGPIVPGETLTKGAPGVAPEEVSNKSEPAVVPEKSAVEHEKLESKVGSPLGKLKLDIVCVFGCVSAVI